MDSKPNIADFTGSEFDVVPFKPVWQPYNQTAITLLDTVIKSLPHVPKTPSRFDKYKMVVGSFLAIAQTVSWRENGALTIPKHRDHWSEYPSVGATMMEYVRQELEEAQFITQVARSGQRHFYKDDDGKLQWVGIQALYTLSDSLYNLVFKPVESSLKGIKTIHVSPVGLLNRIAFDALTCDSSSILSDKYNIYYTSSTATILNKSGLNKEDISSTALFGGIEYSLSVEEMTKIASKYKTRRSALVNMQDLSSMRTIDTLTRGVNWSYLPGSLEETEEIEGILKKNAVEVTLYKDEQGSEEQFKELELNAPSILHVSTHGFYFGDDKKSEMYKDMIDKEVRFAHSYDPLLRSGFILAGGNSAFQGDKIPDDVEDGVLTALEISRLNFFNTKLAVLSACQTGLGDVYGNEGVYGLQRSFKMAGVDYLLFSLWEVPDYQTRQLWPTFIRIGSRAWK